MLLKKDNRQPEFSRIVRDLIKTPNKFTQRNGCAQQSALVNVFKPIRTRFDNVNLLVRVFTNA